MSNPTAVNDGSAPYTNEHGPDSLALMLEASPVPRGLTPDGIATQAPEFGQSADHWCYLQRLSEADALSSVEVLQLLLHFGRSGHRAVGLAAQLLDRFGSLGAAVAADPVTLSEILGDDGAAVTLLKTVRAAVKSIVREPLEDRPVISAASALMDYLAMTMRHESTETTRLLYLDHRNALIKDETQQRGTVDHTPLYPREIVKRAVALGACAVILVHNHVSGDPTPSRADIKMTRQLAAALLTIDVVLHDHVIVSRNKQISFRKLKIL